MLVIVRTKRPLALIKEYREPTDQPIAVPVNSCLFNFNLLAMKSRKCIFMFYAKLYSVNPFTASRYMESWRKDLVLEVDLDANTFESVKASTQPSLSKHN